MKLHRSLFTLFASLCLVGISACDRNGAEETGEWVDDKVEDVEDGLEDIGDDIEDAVDDAND